MYVLWRPHLVARCWSIVASKSCRVKYLPKEKNQRSGEQEGQNEAHTTPNFLPNKYVSTCCCPLLLSDSKTP